MAVTEQSYIGNGSTTNYPFTFPYLKSTDILVQLDQVSTTNWSLANATTIQFTAPSGGATTTQEAGGAPKTGVSIKILRDTNVDNLTATFYAGSSIKSEDLNDNFTQNLYVTQEIGNRSFENTGTSTMIGNLNMGEDTTIVFEGATDNDYETKLTVTDPTADRTITLPNVTGTVITTGDTGTVAHAMLAGDAVDGDNIGDDVINSEHIAAGAVDLEHMSANSVDSDQYVDGSVDRVHLEADIIDGTKLADNAVDSEHITAGSIDLAHMSVNSIDSDQYVDGSIDSAHIGNDQINSQHYAAGSIDLEHMSANSVDSDQYVDGSIDRVHLEADIIDGTKLADNAVGIEHIADAELTTLAGMQSGTASILASSYTLTASIDEINVICDGKTVQTTITDSDTNYPTSGAVVDYVAAQIAPIGGLEVIANEDSFPATQPASGVVISISNIDGLITNGSGVSTNARTVGSGSDNVTINGFPPSLYSKTFANELGLMVSSTGSSHTYTYHKLLAKETDVEQLSNDINDFAARYRVSSNPDGLSSKDEGDLCYDTSADKMKVYDSSTSEWKEVTSTGDFKYLVLTDAGTTNAATYGSATSYDLKESTTGGSAATVTSAAQLLVSVNGVVQKPNTGTSAPAEGFAMVDADTIIFSTAPPANSSIYVVQFGSALSITTPGDNTVSEAKLQTNSVSEEKLKVSNSPTNDLVLTADSGVSGGMKWAESGSVTTWTLGINGSANAYTFTGDGFASATDDPDLWLSRGQTYKFVNGNSSGTHAFNIEKSDHDSTWSAYTTGMTGAGATGGNTMTWTVPMDAPSLFRYVSGTTAGMTGFIYIADGNNSDEGFECWTGSRVSGLQIDNGPNGSHMAFFGTHPTGYQPCIIGESGTTTTFQQSAGYDFDSGNINLQSYGSNTTTPATIKFEGGGSNNTYGVTISGPATAQATSDYTITLPGVVPTSNGQVLSATTAGVCSWADAAGGGAVGGGSDKIFMENGQTVTTNYTIGTEFGAACNALSAGPITINNGVTVTIDSGDNWTIV